MHPELTAQHTRLPSTSFGKRSRNFTKDPKPGEGNHPDPPPFPVKESRIRHGWSARVVAAHLGPDEGLCLHLWRLVHCVTRTAGNGITFAEGREDNPVTPDHSLAANRTRPCQAVSASAFCCTTTPTHSTNHPLPFPHVHQPRRLRHEKVLVCSACTAHRFGRSLLILLCSVKPPGFRLRPGLVNTLVLVAHRRLFCIIDCVEMIDLEDRLLPDGIIMLPVLFLPDNEWLPIRSHKCWASISR